MELYNESGGSSKNDTFKKTLSCKRHVAANFIYKSRLLCWFVPTTLGVKDASLGGGSGIC